MATSFSRSLTLLCALGPALAGCAATIPAYDIPVGADHKPTVASIVTRIQCELTEIVDDPTAEFDRMVAEDKDINVAVELSLSVTDDGSLAPSFEAASGLLTFGTGFKLEQSRAQNFTQELFFSLHQMDRLAKVKYGCDNPADTNLSGKLGLKQAYQLAMTAGGPNIKWGATGPTGVFGGSVTFNVVKELSATGVTWKLAHFSGPGNFASASEKNTDMLTYGFVVGKNAGKNKQVAREIAQDVINRVHQNQITSTLVSIDSSSWR